VAGSRSSVPASGQVRPPPPIPHQTAGNFCPPSRSPWMGCRNSATPPISEACGRCRPWCPRETVLPVVIHPSWMAAQNLAFFRVSGHPMDGPKKFRSRGGAGSFCTMQRLPKRWLLETSHHGPGVTASNWASPCSSRVRARAVRLHPRRSDWACSWARAAGGSFRGMGAIGWPGQR